MLKIGFRTPDELPWPLSRFFEDPVAADFMEGACVFENRSDVARGISELVKLFLGVDTTQGCLFRQAAGLLSTAMFKKPLSKIKTSGMYSFMYMYHRSAGRSIAPLRTSDRRKLKQRIVQEYGVSPELGDLLVPDGLMSQKIVTYTNIPGVSIRIISCFNRRIGAHPCTH